MHWTHADSAPRPAPSPRLASHPCAQDVPAADSPLPGFFAWAAQQQAAGALEFSIKGEEDGSWEAAAAANAPPAPAYPTAEEAEAECVGATARR